MENIWLYVAVGIVVFALFEGLLGLWKGIYKTTTKYLVIGGITLCLVFMMPQLVNYIASFDISTFGGGFDLAIGENVYHFGVLDDVLAQILIDLDLVSSTTSAYLYTSAIALAHTLISYVLFFVLMLLNIFFVGPLLSTILYHCLIKFFIPKSWRKKVKQKNVLKEVQKGEVEEVLPHKKKKRHLLRPVSFLEGTVCGLVVFALFLSPLTSIVGLVSRQDEVYNKLEENGVIDAQVKGIADLIMSYDESILYKTLTLGSSDAEKALDSKVMSYVTATTINGVAYNFGEELNTLLSLLPIVAENLELVDGNLVFNTASLLSGTTVVSIINGLSSSNLLMNLLPALISIATSEVDISFGNTKLNFDDVDWSTQLTALGSIYQSLYDASLLDGLISGSNTLTLDLSKKNEIKTVIKNTFNDKNNVITKNLPLLMAYFGNTLVSESGIQIFSTNIEDYKNIHYGDTLAVLVDFLFAVGEVCFGDTNGDGKLDIDLSQLSSITEKIMEVINNADTSSRDYKLLKAALVGGEVEAESGEKETYDGLLSSELIQGSEGSKGVISFENIMNSMISSNPDLAGLLTPNIVMIVDEYIKDPKEIGRIIDVLPYVNRFSSGVDLSNSEDIDAIKDLLNDFEDSKLVTELIPEVVSTVLTQAADFEDMLFGIKLDWLDFECRDESGKSHVIEELKKLLDVVSDALSLSECITGGDGTVSSIFNNLDTDKLKNVLVKLLENKIINPERVIDGVGKVKNYNFDTLIQGLLGQDSIKDAGIVIPSDISSIVWYEKDSLGNESGEVINLVSAINVLKQNLFLIEGTIDFDTLVANKNSLTDLFVAIGNSKLLSSSLPKILNDKVGPQINEIFGAVSSVSINFNNVDDWGREGQALVNIIEKISTLGIDFSNIDWSVLTEDNIDELLTSIASCSLFGVHKNDQGIYEDTFGILLETLIEKANLSSIMEGELDSALFTSIKDKFTGEIKVGSITTDPVYKNPYWVGTSSDGSDSEIKRISAMIGVLNTKKPGSSQSILEKVSSGVVDANDLKTVLNAILNTRTFKDLIPGAINKAVKDIKIFDGSSCVVGLDLINATTSTCTSENIDSLCDLYAKFKDGTFDTLFSDGSSFTNDEIKELASLLNTLANNPLFSSPKANKTYSLFTELMSAIIFKINMASRVTGSNDEDIARDLLLPLVNNINFIAIDSELDGWGTEIDKDNVSFSYKSAIEKAGNSEILRILTLLKVLSVNSLTLNGLNDIASLSSSAIVAVFDTINHSHLLHRAVPSVFDEIMNSMNISSYITVKGEASETLDVKVHLSSSSEDIAYWSNEIEALGELYRALMDRASGSLDFSSIDIGGTGFSLFDYIGPIDKLNTFAKYKHAIVFNLLYQEDGSGNITGPLKYVRGSTNKAKANYIKNYFFSSAYAGDSTYLKAQCSAIDGLIKAINDGFGSFDLENTNDQSNVKRIIDLLNNLVLGTYADIQVSGGKVTFTRSYFAQEMVSGFISDFFVGTFSDMSSFFSTFFRGEVRSFNDFYNLNAVEIKGIEGLLRLAAAFGTSGGSRNDAIKSAFTLMGRNRNSFEIESIGSSNSKNEILRHHVEEKIYTKAKGYEVYRTYNDTNVALANSRIAIELFERYADKIVIKEAVISPIPPYIEISPRITLKTLIGYLIEGNTLLGITGNPACDYRNNPFENIGEKLVAALTSLGL